MKRLCVAAAALSAALLGVCGPASAGSINGMQQVAVCDPTTNQGLNCAKPDSSGNLPITGSISASLAGFNATAGATATLSASGTSADVALPAGTDIVVSSPSTNTVPVFIRMQAGAGTAVATDMPIVPGAAVGFHVLTATHLSGITAGTAATLQIQGGSGLATGYGGGSSSSTNASVGTNGATAKTSSTLVGVSDGTNQQQVVAPIGLGDGVNGNNMVSTGGWVWNGTTWDRMAGTAAGGVKTNITQVGGTNISTGSGAVGTGTPRVSVGQDTSTVAGAAPATTGIYVTGPSAAALATAANQTVANASLATIATNSGSAIPAGANSIGTLNSSTAYGLQSAASTNATSVKGSAGVITGMTLLNTTTTVYYLRMYNLASAPTCSSATGFVRSWPIPPAASAGLVGGVTPHLPAGGVAASTGIAFCLTGGGSSTDNTNAATGVYVNLDYQ